MEECVGFWKKKEDTIVFEIRDCDEHNSVLLGGGARTTICILCVS